MNRTDRLVAMVMFLQGRRVVRAEEMAGHFEISVRTVYRDIAALGESGVPIAGEAGVGYTLMKGYHLPPVALTSEEAAALFVGGEMVKHFTDASLHPPMESALLKLRAVLPRDRQEHLERLTQNTLVVGSPAAPGMGSSDRQWLLPIQQAVGNRRVLRIMYRGRGRDEPTQRDVEPLGVVFYGGAWYLVGWCRLRNDFRHFRLDRMQSVEIRPEKFETRPDFSLSKHLEGVVTGKDTIPVRVWFAHDALERARRESFAGRVEEKPGEGGAEFSFFTFSLHWMAKWLLSFGTDCEVLAPPELRDFVRAEAEKVIAHYASQDRNSPPPTTRRVRSAK